MMQAPNTTEATKLIKQGDLGYAPLVIAGKTFRSRLFMGTAMYPNQQVMLDSLQASGTDFVTVSIRRTSLEQYQESTTNLVGSRYNLLPNTAGCESVKDAVLTAQLGRESLNTNWVKLELIGDRETLYPDGEQLIQAAEILVKDGFIVLPYCTDDLVVCQRLADVGCAAVMPLGAMIGSGLGIANPHNLELICRRSPVPVICDAGIGTASDATLAMELGCDGVLLNTAVAKSLNPLQMASAMRYAVGAGWYAHRAGRIAKKKHAEPSSPQMGLVGG